MPAIVRKSWADPLDDFDVECLEEELRLAHEWMHDETETLEERAASAQWAIQIEHRLRKHRQEQSNG